MKNKFSVMFHHFHDDINHFASQGSIDASTFEAMIYYLQENYNLLSATEWLERSRNGIISKNDICLSFDDSLKCQIDIALPILEKHNLNAIFAIYTSVVEGEINFLEYIRYFRNVHFTNIDAFYNEFFIIISKLGIDLGKIRVSIKKIGYLNKMEPKK